MGTAEQNNDNAPIAFVLVICAGLSTGIGAAFVFNKKLVSGASTHSFSAQRALVQTLLEIIPAGFYYTAVVQLQQYLPYRKELERKLPRTAVQRFTSSYFDAAVEQYT